MKVSIVTPSFNQAKFLEETILSVLNQTYKNIEYIIIDGGSTDGSVNIIKKYESQLTYWVSEKDNGQSHAINKGFEKCTGDIFAYLNSDDLLEIDAVEKIVNAFIQQPDIAIVYGRCTNIDEHSVAFSKPLGTQVDYLELLKYKMLPKIHQPACFFNKKFLTRVPLIREDLNYVMDYELILWLLKHREAKFIDENIARFRYHNDSKSVSKIKDMYHEKMIVQWQYGTQFRYLWIWRYLKYYIRYKILK